MKNVLRVVITFLLLAELSTSFAQFPGCPQVVTNPVGIVPCGQTCTNLTATAEGGYATTSYTYATIPYAPPVPFNQGTGIPIPGSNGDDYWSPCITLPFTFCYFGTSYTQVLVSSNGAISFDIANCNLIPSSWDITGTAPTNNPADMDNCVMTPWQDLDNTHQGQIFYTVGGTSPCQYFAASWYNCAMYGDAESTNTGYCTLDDHQYQQVIFYETSNVIDINIQAKAVPCDNVTAGTYWNGGLAIEGLVNANGMTFVGPAARNATIWSATNDAMRFTPSGLPTYTITWFQGTTQIGTGSPITVCPAGPTTYTAVATYNGCNGVISVSDSVFVDLAQLTVSDSFHQPSCGSNNGSVYANFNGNSGIISYGWAPGGAGQTTLNNLGPGTYIFTVSDSAGCTKADTVTLTANGGTTVTVANDTFNSCTNASNGTLIADVTGGTGPFTYAWSGSAGSTDTVTGLAPGSYTVTVTAPGGCTATATGTVVASGGPPVVITNLKLINVTCNGGNNGEILDSVSGGPPPYTFNWSNIGVGPDSIAGLTAGNYSVTVTDRFGCTATASYTITQGAPITFNPPVIVNDLCNGGNTGSIIASASGGVNPFTYIWSDNNTGAKDSNLIAGPYTVTATDSSGCTASASYTVSQPTLILIETLLLDSASCTSGGSVSVSAIDGTPPYTYLWSNNGVTDTISGLIGGTYIVTVTDSNGCTVSASAIVPTAANAVTFGPPVIVEPTCHGGNNGSITAVGTSGSGTITYSWSNVDSLAKDSNLVVGTYSVTISDTTGCSASTSYVLNQPSADTITNVVINSVLCNGTNTGSIIITANGGTGTLTYSWSPNSSTSDSALNLGAGTYGVTITDSLGCSISASYNVGQPAPVVIDSAIVTPAGCTTGGSIVVYASGGTGTLTYTWSNTLTGDSIGNVPAGNYSVIVTDQNGCSVSASYVITAVAGAVIIDTAIITNVTCHGDTTGIISVTATDSAVGGPIKYVWGNGDSTGLITNLGAGTYCVTVTDSLGCSASACYTVSQPTAITFDSVQLTPPSCNGDSNGCIIVSATGGTGRITYFWSNSVPGDSNCGIPAGTYTVTAFDSAGCTATATYTLSQPTPDSVSAVVTNITCNGLNNGTITASGSGGNGGFTYTWTGSLTGGTISNLAPGPYCVTATDVIGCSATGCYNITQPPALVINAIVATPVTCTVLGTDSVSASGGTGTLTYSWTPGGGTTAVITNLAAGTYCVTVTDSLLCTVTACDTVQNTAGTVVIDSAHVTNLTCTTNGSIIVYAHGGNTGLTYTWSGTAQTGDTITNLSAGNYSVTVADSTGCSATASYTVSPATPLTITNAVVDSAKCDGAANGSVIITVTGTGTLVYSWSPNSSTTDTASDLAAGSYCVTVTDSLSCSATACYAVGQPLAINISGTTTNVTCSTLGTITTTVTGGTGPYTYTWNPNTVTGPNPTGLAAGQYILIVTDNNGCTATDTFNITGSSGSPVTISSVVIDSVTCFGGSNGSITINTTGGTGHLTYLWAPNGETSASDTALVIGQYGVIVTDSLGCTVAGGPYTVGQPTAITVSGLPTNATCNTPGSITTTVSGGSPGYTYSWTPNTATGPNPTNLLAGSYTVTVTDLHGCTATATFTISGSAGAITLSDTITNVTCNGANDGTITVTPTGGTGYGYTWNPSSAGTGATITNLGPGTYQVTVTASGGCSATASYTVTQPNAISITLNAPSLLCSGVDTGTATVTVNSGGTPPYRYHWSNSGSDTTAIDTNVQAGNIIVTVTDANGCSISASKTVGQDLFDFGDNIIQPLCSKPIPSLDVSITFGGVPPFTYSLNGNAFTTTDTTYIFDSIFPGTYTLTVTDGNGCSLTQNPVVNTPPATDSVGALAVPTSCTSVDNGQILVFIAALDSSHRPFTYSINGGAFQNNDTFTGLAPGSYDIVVHNNLGCNDTIATPIVVTSDSVLTVSFNPDTLGPPAVNADTVPLVPLISGFVNPVYDWSPSTGLSCTSCPNPIYSPEPGAIVNGPTVYRVLVSDSLNPQCAAYDSIIIEPKGQFAMPDAFTPNGDGKNDLFGPVKYSYLTITSFHIYNRWGQLVHNSIDYWDGKFDGKDQPQGTYVYYIEVTHPNGYDYNTIVTEKKEGSVILLR